MQITRSIRLYSFLALSTLFLSACGGHKDEHKEPDDALLVKEVMTKKRLEKLKPKEVLEMLRIGNERFYTGIRTERDYVQQAGQLKEGQFPHSVIVSCMDSRVPTEIVFDMGVGDVYSIKTPGNVVTPEVTGGVEYATKIAGAKVIIVMGNTSSMAVKAAVENVNLGQYTSVINAIKPAVQAVGTEHGEVRNSDNAEFVANVAKVNVLNQMRKLQESQIIKEQIAAGLVIIMGAMYNVETGVVTFFDENTAAKAAEDMKPKPEDDSTHHEDGAPHGGEHKSQEQSHGGH